MQFGAALAILRIFIVNVSAIIYRSVKDLSRAARNTMGLWLTLSRARVVWATRSDVLAEMLKRSDGRSAVLRIDRPMPRP